MLVVALLTVSKIWNPWKYPKMDKRIQKIWHIGVVEYNSALTNKDEKLSFGTTKIGHYIK